MRPVIRLLDLVGLLAGARQRGHASEPDRRRRAGAARDPSGCSRRRAGRVELGSANITPPPCALVLMLRRSRSRPEVRYVNVYVSTRNCCCVVDERGERHDVEPAIGREQARSWNRRARGDLAIVSL